MVYCTENVTRDRLDVLCRVCKHCMALAFWRELYRHKFLHIGYLWIKSLLLIPSITVQEALQFLWRNKTFWYESPAPLTGFIGSLVGELVLEICWALFSQRIHKIYSSRTGTAVCPLLPHQNGSGRSSCFHTALTHQPPNAHYLLPHVGLKVRHCGASVGCTSVQPCPRTKPLCLTLQKQQRWF